jgi:hypothetical protein
LGASANHNLRLINTVPLLAKAPLLCRIEERLASGNWSLAQLKTGYGTARRREMLDAVRCCDKPYRDWLEVTMSLPEGNAAAKLRLDDFCEPQLTRSINNSTNHRIFKGNCAK